MTQTRTVLCFGDSNTYGAIPTLTRVGRHRYAPDRRWPGIMRRQLGSGWEVIEEGHPGRTTVHEDPVEGLHKSGIKALPVCLETHSPIDLVILMLGTNDLKYRFSVTPADIADSIQVLVRAVQRSDAGHGGAAPAVLIASPPPMLEIDWFGEMFRGGAAKSQLLPPLIRDMARRSSVQVFDMAEHVESSTVDGIHFEGDAHKILGTELAKVVQAMLAE